MTKSTLALLWLAAAGLGAGVAVVKQGQTRAFENATARKRGETLFAQFPADKVARITVKSASDSVTLAKGEAGWTVAERENYPASASRINEVLRTLAEVKVTQGIDAGPRYDARFGIDPAASKDEDHGLQLTFADAAGAELAAVALGKNTESAASAGPFGFGGGATGRFIRNRADQSGLYVTSETFARVVATPKDWLREDFVKVEKLKSVAMQMPNKPDYQAWKLTRPDEGADFSLEGIGADETLDATVANPLKSIFSFARFEDVAPNERAKLLDSSPDARLATLETEEGFTYQLKFAPAPKEEKKEEKKEDGQDPAADPAAATEGNYLLAVTVTATIPEQRKKEEGEKEEDAKAKEEAFQKRTTELKEKLATEKQLEGRTFEVTKWTVDALLKDRAQLVKKKDAPAATPAATTPPVAVPPGVTPPPGPATPRPRIEAVTPPIAVPPLPEEGEEPAPAQPTTPEGADAPAQPPDRAIDQPKQPEIRPDEATEGAPPPPPQPATDQPQPPDPSPAETPAETPAEATPPPPPEPAPAP